ncbi:hypothetical protein DJ021_01960 [Phenylobacterium hankyongense]|uniref:Uncharacterized protein n=1 Tax=Phenylobacterium hankyongense TaxID=1813876 RepID=A0A328AVM4_9CAUL|nr:hypothetical protein [Phenylobacterium hankyongense]RAK58647.1 hypothetical protein DJ021_01960 [Phenylobacterium hankyongense]
MRRAALIALAAVMLAAPAQAQLLRRAPPPAGGLPAPPPGLAAQEAEIWPFPAPDPRTWWDDKWPAAPEAADPLGGRKLGRSERLIAIDNGVDASTYRLWGLLPLQWQLPRGEEMILEVWVRPARSVRQSIVRITVRRDGHAFVQGRAGFACCEAGISRRIGFDAELPAGAAQTFLALRNHPMWNAPREVAVAEGGQAADAVCLDGVSYDLTLVVPGRSRSLRRACDSAAIGQVADALEPALGAALGHDPRFDVLYPGGAGFGGARNAYRELTAAGGTLRADPNARRRSPGAEPQPEAAPP